MSSRYFILVRQKLKLEPGCQDGWNSARKLSSIFSRTFTPGHTFVATCSRTWSSRTTSPCSKVGIGTLVCFAGPLFEGGERVFAVVWPSFP